MMVFYVGSALLLLLALIFILWPFISQRLLSKQDVAPADLRESTNISLYHDHLSDIEQSLSSGAITQDQHDQLKVELERNLLEDSQASLNDTSASVSTRKGAYLVGGLAVALLLVSGVLYQELGAYESWQVKTTLDQRGELEREYRSAGDPDVLAQIKGINRELIAQLKVHAKKSPEDVQMRVLLARTAMGLGDYTLAIEHFQGVLKQEPELAQIMSELAQAIFLKAGNKVVPIVRSLVDQALAREPNNTVALGLSGIGAFQESQYQKAITVWRKAVRLQGVNSPNSIALLRGIEAAQQRLGDQADAPPAEVVAQPSDVPSANTVADPSITVSVVLAEGVEVTPETTVFIYARAWQGAKIPLSIARLQVSELPTTLTLTNAMSMAPTMNLNSAKEVELVARISHSGTPVPQAGDWQGTLGPVEIRENNTQPYTLMIADKVL